MKASELILTKLGRRYLREVAGSSHNVDIILIDGTSLPSIKGTSSHYKTNGGRIIWHPNAYVKKGWSNMNYIPSSIRVEVGKDWYFDLSKNICNKVSYLKDILSSLGIDVSFNFSLKTYDISDGDTISFRNLTLKEFKTIATKIIKNKAFI